MNDWTQDLLVNLVATFLGALAALGSGWVFKRHEQKRHETRLLQDLITALYWKRALSPANAAGDRPSDWDEEDRQRCVTSILDARERIREVANALSVSRSLQPLLDDMQTRCIAWLNYAEQHPSDYVTGLVELRARLLSIERTVVERQPGLVLREPGRGDVDPLTLFTEPGAG